LGKPVLLFWLTVTAPCSLRHHTGDGRVRIYMPPLLFGGALVYFLLFSRGCGLSALMAAAADAVWRAVIFPFVTLAAALKKTEGKIKK
jgi:hypothetical protein